MRLKYYMLTLRQMNFKKTFVFLATSLVLLTIFLSVMYKNLKPTLESLCSSNARAIALNSTETVVNEYIKKINYKDLVSIDKTSDGTIQSISANVIQMNSLASDIAKNIQLEIEKKSFGNITIPFGSFVGAKMFGGYGPKIKVKTISTGGIKVKFKSYFDEAGVNQTRHRIVAEIITNVKTISPIFSKAEEYINYLTVAETVIIGKPPSTYYNIRGIEDLTQKDLLNMTN
ncbi:MAG: sporulation protein YunB [Clostridia bacterium]